MQKMANQNFKISIFQFSFLPYRFQVCPCWGEIVVHSPPQLTVAQLTAASRHA
jgi:hypothetical protein